MRRRFQLGHTKNQLALALAYVAMGVGLTLNGIGAHTGLSRFALATAAVGCFFVAAAYAYDHWRHRVQP